ncbi:MAG: ADP-ribosylglycohydrolase family protein [Tepidanaerobacteraceae bacterium]|nr:ADP-ribosylglycohydrolase family protein [Tepidanaerobacteraceae bacterium]
MKAWEMERDMRKSAKPRVLSEEEQTWDEISNLEKQADASVKILWHSEVPGSGAPERLIIGAIQSMENRGYDVGKAEQLIPEGLKACGENDMARLHMITSMIFRELYTAKKDQASPYWNFGEYDSWEKYKNAAGPFERHEFDVFSREFEERIYAGWMGQICGGALGTALEGYTAEKLQEVFGEIDGYVRKPNTYNDDITYELAFLKAFKQKGYNTDSHDIARQWIALIPFGWSAEDVALRNLRCGIYPPESGFFNNPYSEWIGAQMRGAVCGMAAPGDPRLAAELAWRDGVISHRNNGVLGEIFNAAMCSLAFVKGDAREMVEDAVKLIPEDSEYYQVVKYALDRCRLEQDWRAAWAACEKHLEKYNWVHAYPNAAAEVVALWFGNGDFDRTMKIIAQEGQDVDCNAAQIAAAIGIMKGPEALSEKWTRPIGDELCTYMREMKKLSIRELSKWTVECVRKAAKGDF